MDPGNMIAYIILILIVIFAVWGTVKKIRHGSSCCGEHEASDKKVRVSDKDISHYPYRYELAVDGKDRGLLYGNSACPGFYRIPYR